MSAFLTNGDTIVAIATPLGESGLGVVRLSGSNAIKITSTLLSSSNTLNSASTHTLHHDWILDGPDTIDEVVVALFRGPRSYTGEDVVEISSHGSPSVLKKIVDLCLQAGARIAHPGEFTLRAYLNEKMDLSQAEAVADIIHAKSDKARQAATNQLRGVLSNRIKKIRDSTVEILAHIEANLDFVEEDIPPAPKEKIEESLLDIKRQIQDLISTSLKGRWLRDGVHVALAGRPNVGKSSLFNALLAQERAIVTETPGTTRDTLQEKLEWDGLPFVLTDTAGLRSTRDPIEAEGAQRARRAHESSDIVLVVLDGSEPFHIEDKIILREMEGRKLVIAVNKADKTPQLEMNQLSDKNIWVKVSAKKNQGLAELKKALVESVSGSGGPRENAVVTNLRHVRQLESAVKNFSSALQSLQNQKTEEAIAVDIRTALDEIGAITGENTSDDVLASIFRQFCIGK